MGFGSAVLQPSQTPPVFGPRKRCSRGSSHLPVPAPVGEVLHLQRLGPLDQVWKVKVADVVTDDNVWVSLNNQVPPPLRKLFSASV